MYRKAAIDSQRMQFNGKVIQAQGLGAGLFTYFMGFVAVVTTVYFLTGEYTRTIVVQGQIRPTAGMASITPTRPGTVTEIHASAGDFIEKGRKIFTISVREGGLDTRYRDEPIASSLNNQANLVRERKKSASLRYRADIAAIELRRRKLQAEVDSKRNRLSLSRELAATSAADLERAAEIHKAGFMNTRDFEQRKQRMLTSRLELSAVEQDLESSRATIGELDNEIARLRGQYLEDTATLNVSMEQVEQTLLQIRSDGIYTIRAPFSGNITSMKVREGERAEVQQELAQIIKNGSTYEAQLFIFSDSIGFVKPGQSVKIGLDAFPYKTFGTLSGTIKEVSQSASSVGSSNQTVPPYFTVYVDLEKQPKFQHGEPVKLIPGMTLRAWVIAEKQTFLEWLFSPIYAVQKR